MEFLKESFKQKTQEAQILKDGIQKSENTLKASENLVSKLTDEKVRWELQVNFIKT